MKTLRTSLAGTESGAALIVVLMLLVVVTLLGLASMRGALMQEKMAASTAARAVAFQVAESGLRQAELIVRDGSVALPDTPTCADGLCGNPGATGTPAWQASGFWAKGGSGYRTGTAVETSIGAVAPRFVIEGYGTAASTDSGTQQCIDLSKPCMIATRQNIYRMTSYASTPNGSEVILQSLYRH